MNKIMMMGRLAKEPEIKEVGKEKKKVANIVLAVTKPTGKDEADFFNLLLWDKKAEITEKYLSKGMRILIEGFLQNDSYQDKEGNTKYITRIIVTNLEFADSIKKPDELPFN